MNKIMLPPEWSQWMVTELIGSGAFGTVYCAERVTETDVFYSAIKIIEIAPDEENISSMMMEFQTIESVKEYYRDILADVIQEIKTMNSLKGISNIVSLEDYYVEEKPDNIGWTIYIRMELLQSFGQYYLEHILTEADVVQLGIQICTALEFCEQRNIIHRDIKPENIFVSDFGEYKLGDFGVAKQLEKTQTHFTTSGTVSYMAPEVQKGQPYDIRADIYSLGIVMYRLLNRNRDPFVDLQKQNIYYRDRIEAVNRRMTGEPLPVPIEASPEVGKIILKACSYRQEDRYRHPADMKRDLLQLTKQSAVPVKKNKTKKVLPVLLAFVLCFAAGGITTKLVTKPQRTAVEDEKEVAREEQENVEEGTSGEEQENVEEGTEGEKEEQENIEEGTEGEEQENVEKENEGEEQENSEGGNRVEENPEEDPEEESDESIQVIGLPEAAVGETVMFGKFEQDNDMENGREPIEWEVLAVEDGKALLLSKYALDVQPYHEKEEDISWKNCTLRNWLNTYFYHAAFSEGERAAIQTTQIVLSEDSCSEDDVFILNKKEANQYFINEENRIPVSKLRIEETEYARWQYKCKWQPEPDGEETEQNNIQDSYAMWWLRQSETFSYCYLVDGYDANRFSVVNDWGAVRPAIWVEICPNAEITPETEICDLKAGDFYTFGSYEQDADIRNGMEPIEWEVLFVADGQALLLSRYALDVVQYEYKDKTLIWKDRYLRKWLNKDFYETAFSEKEQNSILERNVYTPDNRVSGMSGTCYTRDKIVVPSVEELERYYHIDDLYCHENGPYSQLEVSATEYAARQGVFGYGYTAPRATHFCEWVSRTPSVQNETDTTISSYGADPEYKIGKDVDENGKTILGIGVRPMIWIRL